MGRTSNPEVLSSLRQRFEAQNTAKIYNNSVHLILVL